MSISNGILTSSGDLLNSHLIPVNNGDTYRLTFDIKFSTNDGKNTFYIAMRPFDSDKKAIPIAATYRYPRNSNTTLAVAVKNGDTTITVTDASKWYTGDVSYYKYIGICDNIAWGYGRCTKYFKYSSVSGNVITLDSAWTGGSFNVGTKVACFRAGSVYCYPWISSSDNLPSEWKNVSVSFTGGDSMRFSTQYMQFSTYGFNHVYNIRNLKLENITSYQINPENADTTTNFNKIGAISCPTIGENERNIRYVKDYINGNTVNIYNHWCEIQMLTPEGINIAYNKPHRIDNDPYVQEYVTDGSIDIYNDSTGHNMIVDLGFVTKISELKIWHYWKDGRTYHNNIVSVSEDGVNWDIVYQGEHPETKEGFSIKLKPKNNNIYKNGYLETDKIIEY